MKIDIKNDLWQYLSTEQRPKVMYGMGNGADKILGVCERYGIEISDFFASDGFVRGHSFHGKRVLSYSEMKEKYKGRNPIVLLSFASSLPEVMELFRRVGEECEFYAPDVPVFGDTLFDMNFYLENKEKFDAVYELLSDGESREIYENVIKYKLTGDIKYLWAAQSDRDAVFSELLHAESIKSYADLGAYNGDTLRELIHYAPSLERAVAFEPDKRNFRKLSEFVSGSDEKISVECIPAGAWNENTVLYFNASGNRNSGVNTSGSGKVSEVPVKTLDGVLGKRNIDYIKYDVEGSEREALLGSQKTILRCKPKLLVSLYHRSEDMFALPLLVKELLPEYKLYIRRFPYIPAWDLNLYAL